MAPAPGGAAAREQKRDILAEHFGPDWRTSFGFTPPTVDRLDAEADASRGGRRPVPVLGVDATATWDEIVDRPPRHGPRAPPRPPLRPVRGRAGGGRGADPGHQPRLRGAPGPPRAGSRRQGARAAPGPLRGGPPGPARAGRPRRPRWSHTTTAESTCLASQSSRRAERRPGALLGGGRLASRA